MKNDKGFTLIELLAVVVILIIILTLITPKVLRQLKNAENVTDKQQINAIIETSKLYMNQHSELLPEHNSLYVITLNELKESGLIKSSQILNPSTKEELTGCVIVNYENNKYNYEYNEDNCDKKILVIFDPNGGEVKKTSKIVTTTETYGELPTPTKEGYTFLGWANYNNQLPSDYIKLDYIESHEGPYIDTGLYPNQNYSVEITIKGGESGTFRFGEYNKVGDSNVFYISQGIDKNGQVGFGNSFTSGTSSNKILDWNNKHTYKLENATLYEDGIAKFTINNTLTTFESNRTLLIFGTNVFTDWTNTNSIDKGTGILYNLKIYESNILIRNYTPCYKISSNEIGLYDEVQGIFYSSETEDDFYTHNFYVTNSNNVIEEQNHTLKAIWQANS